MNTQREYGNSGEEFSSSPSSTSSALRKAMNGVDSEVLSDISDESISDQLPPSEGSNGWINSWTDNASSSPPTARRVSSSDENAASLLITAKEKSNSKGSKRLRTSNGSSEFGTYYSEFQRDHPVDKVYGIHQFAICVEDQPPISNKDDRFWIWALRVVSDRKKGVGSGIREVRRPEAPMLFQNHVNDKVTLVWTLKATPDCTDLLYYMVEVYIRTQDERRTVFWRPLVYKSSFWTSMSTNLTGLESKCTYSFRVTAIGMDGKAGAPSNIQYVFA